MSLNTQPEFRPGGEELKTIPLDFQNATDQCQLGRPAPLYRTTGNIPLIADHERPVSCCCTAEPMMVTNGSKGPEAELYTFDGISK